MSGGSDRAQKQAQRNEAERQAAIARTQAAVNAAYESPQREADIQQFIGGLRDYYGQDLDKQKADSDRELKFALARGGLTGGSTQRDKQTVLAKDYQRGLLDVERKAQGAGADLRAADQDARARLVSLSTSGLDMTSATQMAASSMRSALESNKAAMQTQGIGDAFDVMSKFYSETKDAAARRRVARETAPLYGGFGAGYGGGYGGG